MEQEMVLEMAVRAGLILLRFGDETYRVEETINRICSSYGLKCESFAIPTGLIVSVYGEKGITTICKRIQTRTVDLQKVARVNALSRQIEKTKPDIKEVITELDNIEKSRPYSQVSTVLGYGLLSFAFSMLFGGNGHDAVSAFLAGAVLGVLQLSFSKDNSFPFIEYFIHSFSAVILCSVFSLIFRNTNVYIMIIGVLANFVPGVALINGVRDLLNGDYVSGLTKLGEALMVLTVLSAGTGIALSLWRFGGLS
ncbi:MAG: threonine/serine exporter family protein [Clostridiaceae bacterium]|nr:threonine/serine exporter family protein [Clostridiaceae bacterium]